MRQFASSHDENVAIRVRGVSKCYHLYDRPQDRLRQSIYPPIQRMLGRTASQYAREFWALREISFEVKKGQSVGIIGRNGSGKSTLLQIIAGTLQPTFGDVTVQGRVAALLELGSGFNPEFTGRENVFINAAIQGLSRAETEAKFDDIAAFADIGEFIEQPIKTYSSGMMLRLAFAVQVAMRPEVLIVDEALAVGDMRFSMKCIRRMRELIATGTSCLFVSHDMSSIVNFCHEAIWLQDGTIVQAGDTKTVTMNYSNFMSYGFMPPSQLLQEDNGEIPAHNEGNETERMSLVDNLCWIDLSHLPSSGMGGARIVQLALCKKGDGETCLTFVGGEQVQLFLRITSLERLLSPIICADFRDSKGNLIFGFNTFFMNTTVPTLHPGHHMVLKFGFRVPLLSKGNYGVSVAIADGDYLTHVQHHIINEATVVQVLPSDLRQLHYMIVNEDCDCHIVCQSKGSPTERA